MTDVNLTIACQAYDRVQALQSGEVRVEGCRTRFLPMRTEDIFRCAYDGAQFEVTELSMSSHILMLARGLPCQYLAIPVFPSRMFRHSAIYIRTDRGIDRPRDLAGRTVGVPEYQMTAALWARGMLSDEYGVATSSIRWRTGGLEEPGRKEKFGLTFGDGVTVAPIASGQALSPMLASGEIDALITARAPSCYSPGHPGVDRLFKDHRSAEEAYFRKTLIFPIMHVIGVRRDIVDRYPWVPASLTKAFDQSKRNCMWAMYDVGAVSAALPWLGDDLARTVAVMGEDYWPYGVPANRTTLETMLRYSFEQGLSPRKLELDELFAPGTLGDLPI
ncbi:ABC transporter substrate-binding protein [Sphingomonas bacterium]|uniref:ABC transporter substrate-binding protein n=1 Tax=Sphingomonas bacterium TaxID=1895847 RepID=UPI001576E5AD|nr:ABC transporter substrate-binding protein [Sphingomonas bacterium]